MNYAVTFYVVIALISVVGILIANFYAMAHVIRRCIRIPLWVGLVLLLFPGLQPIALILLAVSGIMLITRKCISCNIP
jgi:hypothetical protein